MATNYLGAGLDSFYYHDQDLAVGGYDYYWRINVLGFTLIQRQNTTSKVMDYYYCGDGTDSATVWAGKTGYTYKRIDQI